MNPALHPPVLVPRAERIVGGLGAGVEYLV